MNDALILTPGTVTTVSLLKAGHTKIRYAAEVLADDGAHVVVKAPWAGAGPKDFGFVRFEKGDVFTEHYWRDRWYSVKEVRSADGTRKGWYCDVARPARVTADGVEAEDLDLDLWLSGDGHTVLRLDEDEFAESGLAEREPATADAAWRALDELEGLARSGGFEALLAVA
ncbi:DUF402 domain-containing protein [Streptomyces cinnamoneus]|uniref:DUF402 domain-containing protein n=1 Tax=Streptomyces cinnamoneus TaxID=53446 RepID=UPI0034404228